MNNNFFFPSERSNVKSFKVMELLAEAGNLERKGKEIFHLELGEPQSLTPSLVKKEIRKAIGLNLPGYTPSNGIKDLRESIKVFYSEKYGLKIDSKNIFITTGSSGAFLLSFLSCFDNGNKVGILNPVYPAYRNILKSLNIDVVDIFPDESDICKIDVRKVMEFKFLDGLIISNPNNPNGQIFKKHELKFIYNFCEKNKIRLICDEIYHGIEYRTTSESILNIGFNAIIINSFSKYFCMPGWRLGWAILPDSLVDNFLRLSQNLFISSGNIAQYSAIKVFNCLNELNKIVEKYFTTRNVVSEKLSQIPGLKFHEPEGAFYFYIDLSEYNENSEILVKRILKETGVVLTPGTDFDTKFGTRTLRLAFSISHERVVEGVNRMCDWFNKNY